MQIVGLRRHFDPHTAFKAIEETHRTRRFVAPGDRHIAGVEHLAQLVAHQVDDGLEVQLRAHALLDAVDHREFGGALFGLGASLGQLVLQRFAGAQMGQRRGSLAGKRRQQRTVDGTEAAHVALDVGVQVTHQLLLCDQRRDEAGALVRRRNAIWPVAQACSTRLTRLRKPRRDRGEQLIGRLTGRQPRGGRSQAVAALQYQQHALGAAQCGGFVDQNLVQVAGAARFVQTQRRRCQASQRLLDS